jgi:hypothetical protein
VNINTVLFVVILSFVCFSLPSFADNSEEYAQTTAAEYQEAEQNLRDIMSVYPESQAGTEQFYAEQKRKLDEVSQQLEIAHQTGQMSEADYEEAKKGLAETREFILTEGKNLGPQMAALNQAAAPIMAAHSACQNLENDPQGYQACIQSKIE